MRDLLCSISFLIMCDNLLLAFKHSFNVVRSFWLFYSITFIMFVVFILRKFYEISTILVICAFFSSNSVILIPTHSNSSFSHNCSTFQSRQSDRNSFLLFPFPSLLFLTLLPLPATLNFLME